MKIDNVADLIAETLAQAGVKRIFGVVGDSLNGLTDALRKREGDRLDSRSSRGGRGLCRRGRSADHGRTCGVCGIVRPRQSASHQRPVRCAPQPHPGAGDCRADSVRRNRRRLLSGDASAGSVPGMQPLLRTDFRSGAASLRAGKRHSRGGGPARRCRHRHPGRRRVASIAHARRHAERWAAAARAHRPACGCRTRSPGRTPERRQARHAVLRPRLCRRA